MIVQSENHSLEKISLNGVRMVIMVIVANLGVTICLSLVFKKKDLYAKKITKNDSFEKKKKNLKIHFTKIR